MYFAIEMCSPPALMIGARYFINAKTIPMYVSERYGIYVKSGKYENIQKTFLPPATQQCTILLVVLKEGKCIHICWFK